MRATISSLQRRERARELFCSACAAASAKKGITQPSRRTRTMKEPSAPSASESVAHFEQKKKHLHLACRRRSHLFLLLLRHRCSLLELEGLELVVGRGRTGRHRAVRRREKEMERGKRERFEEEKSEFFFFFLQCCRCCLGSSLVALVPQLS